MIARLTIVVLAALALTANAAAGNPSLCAKDGWQSAQSATGSSFSSPSECAKAHEIYQPSVVLGVTHVNANESYSITGIGFHPNTQIMATLAVTGQTPYYSNPGGRSDGSGNISATGIFTDCGGAPPYDITVGLTDSYGVHASARITVC